MKAIRSNSKTIYEKLYEDHKSWETKKKLYKELHKASELVHCTFKPEIS